MTCYSRRIIQLKEPLIYDDGRAMTHINVDCNKCIECLERRKTEWCFRIYQEFMVSKTAYFTTLTYDNEHIPINKYGKMNLEPGHLVKFLKKLRHHHGKLNKQNILNNKQSNERRNKGLSFTIESLLHGLSYKDKLSYVACGEYGELRKRPHYHLILFNASDKHIQESWEMGNVYNVKLTSQDAASYVLKYMDKQTYNEKIKYKNKEFLSFSEGIGSNYIEKYKEWHKRNLEIAYVPSNTGAMLPMPKYYRNKIYNELERKTQVQYIENKIESERQEQISLLGLQKYNEKIIMKKRVNRIKFNRSLQHRITD